MTLIRPPSMCTCFIGFFVFAAFLVDMIVLKMNMNIKMYYKLKVCIGNAILRQLPLPVGGACKKPRKTSRFFYFHLETWRGRNLLYVFESGESNLGSKMPKSIMLGGATKALNEHFGQFLPFAAILE